MGKRTLKSVFDSPYEQYRERNGHPFEIIRTIGRGDKDHDWEVLPWRVMFAIRFPDGCEIEAWPEEIFD